MRKEILSCPIYLVSRVILRSLGCMSPTTCKTNLTMFIYPQEAIYSLLINVQPLLQQPINYLGSWDYLTSVVYGERQPRVPALGHLFNYVGNSLDRALPIVWCPVHMPFLLPPKLETQGHEFQEDNIKSSLAVLESCPSVICRDKNFHRKGNWEDVQLLSKDLLEFWVNSPHRKTLARVGWREAKGKLFESLTSPQGSLCYLYSLCYEASLWLNAIPAGVNRSMCACMVSRVWFFVILQTVITH